MKIIAEQMLAIEGLKEIAAKKNGASGSATRSVCHAEG
jgi:hypothetical protein